MFLVLQNPHPPENSNPFCGGRGGGSMDIFYSHTIFEGMNQNPKQQNGTTETKPPKRPKRNHRNETTETSKIVRK